VVPSSQGRAGGTNVSAFSRLILLVGGFSHEGPGVDVGYESQLKWFSFTL